MNKEEINKSVKAIFKANPDVKEVFVTSDGFIFLTENAADLHKNTNSSGKKLGLDKMSKKDVFAGDKPKTLSQMNKTELEAVAKEKGVDISKAANNKERAKLIADFVPAPPEPEDEGTPGTPGNRSDSDQVNTSGGKNNTTK